VKENSKLDLRLNYIAFALQNNGKFPNNNIIIKPQVLKAKDEKLSEEHSYWIKLLEKNGRD